MGRTENSEVSSLMVKINNAIKKALKEYDVKTQIGKETGILTEDTGDLVLYAKIRINDKD